MKKRVLVLIMVVAFTLLAASTAFAVVQEEPVELQEGEMAVTSVEGEGTDPNQPVSSQTDDLKRSNDSVDQPNATADEEVRTISAPEAGTEEDVRVIMAPDSSGVPEMAQTGIVEDTKKENNNIYYIATVVFLVASVVVLIQRRKRSN